MMRNSQSNNPAPGFDHIRQAIENDDMDAVNQYIFKNGGDINITDAATQTPGISSIGNSILHIAVYYGRTDIVGLLLGCGATVNVKNMYGNTPLHEAAFSGMTGIAVILVDFGADVNAKNNKGVTALDNARKKKHVDIIALLKWCPQKHWATNKWSLALGFTIAVMVSAVAAPWIAVCAGLIALGLGKTRLSRLNKAIDARVVSVGNALQATPIVRRIAPPILPSVGPNTAENQTGVAPEGNEHTNRDEAQPTQP